MLLNVDSITINASSTQSYKYEVLSLSEMIEINTNYIIEIDKVEVLNYSTSINGIQTYLTNDYIAESSKVVPQLFNVQSTQQKFEFSINRFNTTKLIIYAGEPGRTAGNSVKLTGIKIYKKGENPSYPEPKDEQQNKGSDNVTGEIYIATQEYVDNKLENTKGTISAKTDTGEVSSDYLRQINASGKSKASGEWSQVNASYKSTASGNSSQVNASHGSVSSGGWSQVNASYNSTAISSHTQVNASNNSIASGLMSQINASKDSYVNKACSQVNCSENVINDKPNTVVGGYSISEASTKNIKWELSSKEGTIKSSGAITGNSTFADFAEYFESLDGKSIPTGTIVTLQEDKIRPCNKSEEMLGVISETAGVLLNASGFCWQDRYVKNEFGGLIYEEVLDKETERYITVPKENPQHDIKEKYIAREDREEWNIVGLTGQVYVRIDDTINTGDFIKSGNDGIATKDENPNYVRWKVMKITTPYDKEKGYGVALVFIR